MLKRYWLVHPHGGWQRIDPEQFDLAQVAEQARRIGGRLIVEDGKRAAADAPRIETIVQPAPLPPFPEADDDLVPGEEEFDRTAEAEEDDSDEELDAETSAEEVFEPSAAEQAYALQAEGTAFEPPVLALGHMFRMRLRRIYVCKINYQLEMNCRATARVLGGYYKSRALVRIYTHDQATGRRTVEELFDTFLHEMAHHIEYTEPESFRARKCGRVKGCMHSRLFWRILGELKGRWMDVVEREQPKSGHSSFSQ